MATDLTEYKAQEIKNLFYQDGFIHLKNVLSLEITQNIKNLLAPIIDKCHENSMASYFDEQLYSIQNIHHFKDSGIAQLLEKTPLNEIAEFFLDAEAEVVASELFLKPALTKGKTPAHQDDYYFTLKKHFGLNIWIALEDASKNNGGLYYLKGSHRLGPIKHNSAFKLGKKIIVDDAHLDEYKDKIVFPEVKMGDCLVHHSLVVHGSDNNPTEKSRMALTRVYAVKGEGIDEQRKNQLLKQKFKDYVESKKKLSTKS